MIKQNSKLIFLKLGGSLITDKSIPHTAKTKLITRLAKEIKQALLDQPDLQLLIGHGSGSFGHVPADKYDTRQGVSTPTEWQGFWEVWKEAHELHQIILRELPRTGLKGISFSPSASILTINHKINSWDTSPIFLALENQLIPIIHGDVVFDAKIGGTILSTEELFIHLANTMKPSRILLAGNIEGVFADFPRNKQLITNVDSTNIQTILKTARGAVATDVTGGMLSKVESMWSLCQKDSCLRVQIFSAQKPGALYSALMGAECGTSIQK